MAQLIFFSLGQMRQLLRTVGGVIVTGVAGGVAWRIAMRIIFGSASRVLTNPSLQSSKMLNAFLLSPVPRTSHQPEPALDRLVIYWNPVGPGLSRREYFLETILVAERLAILGNELGASFRWMQSRKLLANVAIFR